MGSKTNVSIESDPRRAAILVADPDGKRSANLSPSGLTNAWACHSDPALDNLWAAVNERDDIGDDVPSDYFTHIVEGGFYGWPLRLHRPYTWTIAFLRGPTWWQKRLSQTSSLGSARCAVAVCLLPGTKISASYRGRSFIAEHGSWNLRWVRSGYQVVFIPFRNGRPDGEPNAFLSGSCLNPTGRDVYGRMVGVAVAADGALLISDDGGKLIWRVSCDDPVALQH